MFAMSPEMYAIIGATICVTALVFNGQLSNQRRFTLLQRNLNDLSKQLSGVRKEMNDLRYTMHREFAAVRDQIAAHGERLARLEGVTRRPGNVSRDTGTDIPAFLTRRKDDPDGAS